MAKRLVGSRKNELTLRDNLSNSEIILYYRDPTSEERIAFGKMAVQRKRNKVTYHTAEARLKYGDLILLGFREGDFEIEQPEGSDKFVPISSDPNSPKYFPHWREHVKKYASDLVSFLGAYVFDASVEDESDDGEVKPDNGEDAE